MIKKTCKIPTDSHITELFLCHVYILTQLASTSFLCLCLRVCVCVYLWLIHNIWCGRYLLQAILPSELWAQPAADLPPGRSSLIRRSTSCHPQSHELSKHNIIFRASFLFFLNCTDFTKKTKTFSFADASFFLSSRGCSFFFDSSAKDFVFAFVSCGWLLTHIINDLATFQPLPVRKTIKHAVCFVCDFTFCSFHQITRLQIRAVIFLTLCSAEKIHSKSWKSIFGKILGWSAIILHNTNLLIAEHQPSAVSASERVSDFIEINHLVKRSASSPLRCHPRAFLRRKWQKAYEHAIRAKQGEAWRHPTECHSKCQTLYFVSFLHSLDST